MMSSNPSSPSLTEGDVQHFPLVPSYVVALSVVAGVVVTVMVLMVLYYCLVKKSKRRQWATVEQLPTRETEQLREEAVVDQGPLCDDVPVLTGHTKPRPSPSIFSRGDFLMEVLDGVENTSNFSNEDIKRDEVSLSHICEADRVTVAMDDLEMPVTDDENPAPQISSPIFTTPPRASTNMAIFLENLATPILTPKTPCGESPSSGTMGLRVRHDSYQADASTAALRGSFSSEQGVSDSEGGEVEIYEDPVDNYSNEGGDCEDVDEKNVPCVDSITVKMDSDDTAAVTEELSSRDLLNKLQETLVISREVDCKDDQVEVDEEENGPDDAAIVEVNGEENSPGKISYIEVENILGEAADNQATCSEVIQVSTQQSDITRSISSLSLPSQASMHSTSPIRSEQASSPEQVIPTVSSTPGQTIPVNIIPISDQKARIPNTPSVGLSQSTTSLLHPLVSMHALPLTERAVSVSHLSLNRSGTHLPATPLSCHSTDYSPVYSMKYGSARRLGPQDRVEEDVDTKKMVKSRDGCGEVADEEQYPLEVDVIIQEDTTTTNLSPE